MKQRAFAPIAISAIALLGLTACDDATEETEEEEAETTEEESSSDEDSADEEEPEAEEEDEPEADDSDLGSRDNPYPLGETFNGVDWDVTVSSIEFNADQAVADANEFNDPAPDGSQFVLIDASVTYNGEDSEMVMMGVDFAYVTDSGETHTASDTFEVAPDSLDLSAELYNGGTEAGNVLLAIPEDATGLIRVNTGFFDQEDAFFATE